MLQHENQRTGYPQAVRHLDIDLGSGNASVVVESRSDVLVERRLTWSFSRPGIQENVTGDTLRVRTGCSGWFGSCEASYTVHVPDGTSVRAHTGSGNVVARGAAAVTASSGSGNVDVTDVAGDVTAATDSGDIGVAGVRAGTMSLRTGSGNIRATLPDDGAAYNVSVHTGSGSRDVAVRTDPGSAHTLSARTGSGNVSVRYAGR